VYAALPVYDVRLPFLVTQVRPPVDPTTIEIRVRLVPSDATALARPGDVDLGLGENPFAAGATVTSAFNDGQLTFKLPAVPTARGWDYAGQLLRVGGPFQFVSRRYQLNATVATVPPLPENK
jgi:hypothetical protein